MPVHARVSLAFIMVVSMASTAPIALAQGASLTADSKNKALAAVREGNKKLDAGKPHEALAKFEEAHALVGGDKLYYNIGQALTAMGRREVDAYVAFEKFLRAPNASADTLAAARKQQVDLRTKIAFLFLNTTPSGARITIDGKPWGTTPLAQPEPLDPGLHGVTVELDGYRTVNEAVTLAAAETTRRDLVLQSATMPEPAVAVAPPASAPALAPALPDSLLSTHAEPPREDDAPIYSRWWFWTGVGGAVVASAVLISLSLSGTNTTYDCGNQECVRLK